MTKSFCQSFHQRQLEASFDTLDVFVHDDFDIEVDDIVPSKLYSAPLQDFGITEQSTPTGPHYRAWVVATTVDTFPYRRPELITGPPTPAELATAEVVVETHAVVTPVFSETFGEVTIRHIR